MRLKLLYLSQCFPVPLDGGGTIKTFNTIKTLSKKFDIYTIFISERRANKKQTEVFTRMGVKLKVFQTNTMKESIKNNYWRLFWNYLQLRPHFVYQYRYIQGIRYIKKVIKKFKPDVIHVDHINSSQFLPSRFWLKKNLGYIPVLILENHNLNHIIFKTRFDETKKIIRKIYLLLEGSLNYLYGRFNYNRYDHIFSISEQETLYLKKYYKSVSTQPLVYPLPGVKISQNSKKYYDILFLGNLTWPPNELAMLWFLDKVFPLVIKKLPDVKVHIVGKYNSIFNKFKGDKNLIFYGYKKNIYSFLQRSNIFILPFKTGAGVRIKSLTALQSGIPIVSTKMGVEGLRVKNEVEYLEANNNQKFSDSVIYLLSNKKRRNIISEAQIKYFKKNHSTLQNKIFIKDYLRVINKLRLNNQAI